MSERKHSQVDLTHELTTIINVLATEMSGRIEADLSVDDLTAILNGLSKAVLRTVSVTTHSIEQITSMRINLTVPAEPDLWAHRQED